MNHNFALAPAIGVGACLIKHPAKKSAKPSTSSRLVTLDTSTAHQNLSCSLVIARRLLTLIRSHNDDCAHIWIHTVLLVRVSMAGVVVVVVDESLVKIWRIGQRDDGRDMRGSRTAYIPLSALWPEVVGYAFLLRFREFVAQNEDGLDDVVDVLLCGCVSTRDCFECFRQLHDVSTRTDCRN